MQPLDLIVIISVRFTRANSYTFSAGVSAVHYLESSAPMLCLRRYYGPWKHARILSLSGVLFLDICNKGLIKEVMAEQLATKAGSLTDYRLD
jgi:hypothetical protein